MTDIFPFLKPSCFEAMRHLYSPFDNVIAKSEENSSWEGKGRAFPSQENGDTVETDVPVSTGPM